MDVNGSLPVIEMNEENLRSYSNLAFDVSAESNTVFVKCPRVGYEILVGRDGRRLFWIRCCAARWIPHTGG